MKIQKEILWIQIKIIHVRAKYSLLSLHTFKLRPGIHILNVENHRMWPGITYAGASNTPEHVLSPPLAVG